MSDPQRFGRELEEDHDVLTFNESAARLREEIAKARAELADLEEHEGSAGAEAVKRARERLAQLTASQERNSAQTVKNADGRSFFNYRPLA